jgi:enoyl-CoA hydratase/carnithine racemase
MADDVILLEVTERVATVTLNRPEARNALSPALLDAIPDAITTCEARDDVDVVVLTGADPAFCAGIDLKYLGSTGIDRESIGGDRLVGEPFPARTKPIIGAVNGAAVTGGLELALACDFLVASERARFADTHARVGIMPGWGLTVRLAEAVGQRRAREMSTTGNFIDAATALSWGLVNHVIAHDELLPTALRLATDIVSNDQLSVRNLLETYEQEVDLATNDQRVLEVRRSRAWMKAGHGSPEEVERRRAAIIERGRAQQ